jgi:hypothetical protein
MPAVGALEELPDDITIGLNHWPVQVSARIAVMLGCLAAAIVPDHRRLPIVAVALTSVSIGACMARKPRCRHRHRGWRLGIGCVLWGTVLAWSSGNRSCDLIGHPV